MYLSDKVDQQSKASTPTSTSERPLPMIPTSTQPTSTPHLSQQQSEGTTSQSEPMDTSSNPGVKVPSGSDSPFAKVSSHITYTLLYTCTCVQSSQSILDAVYELFWVILDWIPFYPFYYLLCMLMCYTYVIHVRISCIESTQQFSWT